MPLGETIFAGDTATIDWGEDRLNVKIYDLTRYDSLDQALETIDLQKMCPWLNTKKTILTYCKEGLVRNDRNWKESKPVFAMTYLCDDPDY